MGDYEFRDLPISVRALKQLIVEHFCDGRAAERKEIIKTCRAAHLDRGGIEAKDSKWVGAFKGASTSLRKLGVFEKAAHQGYWRSIMPAGFKRGDKYALKKLQLYVGQDRYCNGCENPFDFGNLTVDHKMPNGNDNIDNLQLLCSRCNSVKGNRSQAYLLDKLKKSGIIS